MSSEMGEKIIIAFATFSFGLIFPFFVYSISSGVSSKDTNFSLRKSANITQVKEIALPQQSGLSGPTEYNCELSGGAYVGGRCVCPLEMDQTQDQMYDTSKGFCQTTFGGPGGDAFAASVGLPYGDYEFYGNIISGLCEKSGGSISGAACMCPVGSSYYKNSGQCI